MDDATCGILSKDVSKIFDFHYDKDNSRFEFSLFGKSVLGNYIAAMIGKENAKVESFSQESGEDELGVYCAYILHCKSPTKTNRTFTCSMNVYSSFIVFETVNLYEIKGKKNKSPYGNPYISFPAFSGEHFDKDCSILTFKRQVPFNYPEIYQGSILDSLREGKNSPLIVTNRNFETIILSPLNHMLFGTVSINKNSKRVRCGIPRSVNTIQKDMSYKTILVFGYGVNDTIDHWGSLLRRYHQTPEIHPQSDVLLKYISYWTNAGSAYWYRSYKKKSYENTMKSLVEHHRKIGLHFGSYQLDSWWYKKEGDQYFSGISEWEPREETKGKNFNSLFPFAARERKIPLFSDSRLSYVSNDILGTPLGCHFKQLAKDSVYVEKQPEDYVIDGFPMPKNGEMALKLFKTIFKHPRWNLSYIIHDWLSYMTDHHKGFKDMDLAEGYFYGLDRASMETPAPNVSGHLSLQLCMAQPHMTLNSVTMPSVTTVRSTSDSNSFFVEGTKRWWWHLYSSKFITALGKYPFYDNRFTNKSHLYPLSAYSKFELIWLGLSCGPIGIGDKLGKENVSLILRCIKEDGEIIKPDKPAAPLDKCFLENPNDLKSRAGVAVYTHSKIHFESLDNQPNTYHTMYLLNFNVHPYARTVSLSYCLEDVGAKGEEEYAIYDYFAKSVKIVTSKDLLRYTLKRRKFYYQITAPIINGFALIGDVSKHISASSQLIESICIYEKRIIIRMKYAGNRFASNIVFFTQNAPKKVQIQGKEIDFRHKNKLVSITPNIDKNDLNSLGMYTVTIVY